jgi:hypothetical protein
MVYPAAGWGSVKEMPSMNHKGTSRSRGVGEWWAYVGEGIL